MPSPRRGPWPGHVVAGLLGTPTAPPRDALVPPDAAAVRWLEEVVARRP